ncbi:MAG: Ig-like domain repeat protein [Terracidiphilus sp.]|jgi:sugar lactone lactonase YvrE
MICLTRSKSLLKDGKVDTFPCHAPSVCAAWNSIPLRTACLAPFLLMAAHAQAQFGAQPVGAFSNNQGIQVTATVPGTVTSVEVLTLGSANRDFAASAVSSNCASANLVVGGNCTQSVSFTPAAAGLRLGAVVLVGTVNGANTVLGMTYLSGTGTGGLGVLVTGNMTPVAGQLGFFTGVADGQPATQAVLDQPGSVVLDGAGNMYIADTGHNRVRIVCGAAATPTIQGTTCAGAGIISTIAGDGNAAYTGDDGPAANATLNSPGYVAFDGAGNLYIADTGNNVIRKMNAVTGAIATVAGNGSIGNSNLNQVGDGGLATSANLNQPQGVSLDASGNLYIADTNDHRIREVNAATGIITTVAGSGYTSSNGTGGYNGDNIAAGTAQLNFPYAVAFDPAGNMYIPDSQNNRIREVLATGGVVTANSHIVTYAGTGNTGATACVANPFAATQAVVWSPSGVAVDAAGNVFIAETQNAAIRKVNAITGLISTLVQTGCGNSYAGSKFVNWTLYAPAGLFLDGSGNLYIADTLDMVIEKVQGNFAAINVGAPVRQTETSQPLSQTVENDGNAALELTAITATTNAEIDAAVANSCSNGQTLAVGAQCEVGAIFAPVGTPALSIDTVETPNIDVGEDTESTVAAPGSPLVIEVVGTAAPIASTVTTVASSLNPSGFGQKVTFTVTVNAAAGTGSLTGTISISDTVAGNTATLASGLSPNASGVVTFSISTLAVGQHSISASYDNTHDPVHMASTSSPALIETVLEGTAVSLTSSANPSAVGQSVTVTATVTSLGGGVNPTGTVTFFDGSMPLSTPTINGNDVVTYTTPALTNGTHQITAVYNGSSSTQVQGSTSPALNQDVQAASTIAVSSSLNPSTYGVAVTFTVTVTSGATFPATGIVNFLDSGVSIGTATLRGNPGVTTFTTTTLAAGTHPITVSYAGDNYNQSGSSAPLNQVVEQGQTVTTVSATPIPGIAGTSETLSATVILASGSAPLAGTVTFTSGTTQLGSALLNGSGVATITPTLAAGAYEVIATYGGNANATGSGSAALACSGSPLLTCSGGAPLFYAVVLATTQTALTVSPNPAIVFGAITFSATVTGNGATPAGSVNFLADGVVIGTSPLSGGSATFTDSALPAGSHTMTAEYLGNANDAVSTSANVSETVDAISTTTSLGTAATTGVDPQVVLVATVVNNGTGPAATGTVTFYNDTTSSGTGTSGNGATSLGKVTLDKSGVATLTPNLVSGASYSIYAVYGGDSDHGSSTSQTASISGTSSGFTVTVTPSTVTIPTSQNATVTVTLTSTAGFTDTVGLGCASLPAVVNCHFASASVNLPAGGTVSTELTIDTNNPLGGGASAMNRRGGSGRFSLAGFFLPFSLAFGCLFRRLRRRNVHFLTMALSMIVAVILTTAACVATGCSSFSQVAAAPGNYVIQVTGTGAATNVIEFQNVNLSITN